MIALVAAGRGGDSGPAVKLTVPWSPGIAERGGELPGFVYRFIRGYLQKLTEADGLDELRSTSLEAVFAQALLKKRDLIYAFSVRETVQLMRELGLLEPGAMGTFTPAGAP